MQRGNRGRIARAGTQRARRPHLRNAPASGKGSRSIPSSLEISSTVAAVTRVSIRLDPGCGGFRRPHPIRIGAVRAAPSDRKHRGHFNDVYRCDTPHTPDSLSTTHHLHPPAPSASLGPGSIYTACSHSPP